MASTNFSCCIYAEFCCIYTLLEQRVKAINFLMGAWGGTGAEYLFVQQARRQLCGEILFPTGKRKLDVVNMSSYYWVVFLLPWQLYTRGQ